MKITTCFILLVLPTLLAATAASEISDIPLGPPVRHKRTVESTPKVFRVQDNKPKLTAGQKKAYINMDGPSLKIRSSDRFSRRWSKTT